MRVVGRPVRPGRASGRAALRLGPEPVALPPGLLPAERILVTAEADSTLADGTGSRFAGIVLSTEVGPRGDPAGPGPPAVGSVDGDVFRIGDEVRLDGKDGTVELPNVEEVAVVTAFLQRADGRVLLLRRSDRVGSFRGRWAAVSGFLEAGSAWDQAVREIREETGIERTDLQSVTEGPTVYAREGDRMYAVHPFRVQVDRPEIRLDWEHTEFEWVDPREIGQRPGVPKLLRVWETVRPDPLPIAPPRRPKVV